MAEEMPTPPPVPRWWDEAWSVDPVPDCVKRPKPRIARGIDLADVETVLIGDGIPPGDEGWERCTLLNQLHHLAAYYQAAQRPPVSVPGAPDDRRQA
jgi:hypothetical protein